MPRRVWTYPGDLGWDTLNMISTVGAYILATGVLVFVIDVFRLIRSNERVPDNPWGAGTLEWLPNDVYSTRSIPLVATREPLWDRPSLPREVAEGRHFLPNAPTGGRETIVTSAIEGKPQYIIQMPGPGWAHLIAAVFTAAFFLLLTIKLVVPAVTCGIIAIGAFVVWGWSLDPGPGRGKVDIGAGLKLPTYMAGPSSHSWWAMVVLVLVASSLYIAYVFSYLYLWVVSPDVWSPTGSPPLPGWSWPASGAGLIAVGTLATWLGGRALPRPGGHRLAVPALIGVGALCLTAAVAIELYGHWETGLRPAGNAYGAMVYMQSVINGQLALAIVILAGFAIARYLTGRLDRERRVSFDNGAVLYYYAAVQAVFGLLLIHGFPRMAA
jgi:cytochrome c oxidase subunit I+III